jgi:hypothetical protein
MMMAAAAGIAMRMMVVVAMLMSMVVLMPAMGVLVRMAMMVLSLMVLVGVAVMVVSVVVVARMGAALRPEGALHGGCRAALPPRHFGESRIVFDVEGIARDLHEAVLAAQMPGKARQAKGVLGPDLQKMLRRSLHLHQAAVLQPQGVAVVDGGLHVEIEQDLGSALAFQRPMAAVPCAMVEGHRVDDTVGLHGRFADDGGDAGHGFISSVVGCWVLVVSRMMRDRSLVTTN